MIDLRGKGALVTGAGTRVGAAIACALGQQGMRVAVHHHGSAAGAEDTRAEIERLGGQAFTIRADLSLEAEVVRLARESIERLGGLDLLVPSAASYQDVSLDGLSKATLDASLDLNLLAPLLLAREARNALERAGGSIVLVTCISRMTPSATHLPYQLSKAALHQAMRALALALAPRVRVNAVAPGTVLPPLDMSESALAEAVSRIPLGHVGSAQAVANAVVHLARSPFVTGTELVVDGGRSLG